MATQSSESWHVRASIGSELGPIDTDTLLTMSDGGLLCDDDVVRRAAESDWRPLKVVIGEIRAGISSTEPESATSQREIKAKPQADVAQASITEQTSLPEKKTLTSHKAQPDSANQVMSQPVEDREQRPPARTKPLPGWSKMAQPAAQEKPLKVSAIVVEEKHPESLQDGETGTSMLDQWKSHRRETIDRLLSKVAEREAAAILESEAANDLSDEEPFTQIQTDSIDDEVSTTTEARSNEEAKKPVPEPTPIMKEETFMEKRDRWLRSLPSWQVVAAMVLLIGCVIYFWPVSIRKGRLVARFHAMYCQLERLRSRPQDRTGMEEFSRETTEELENLIPHLKELSADRNEDSKLLLWMARDCLLPILKSPRDRDSKHDRDLKKLFASWDKQHQTNYAVIPDPLQDSSE